MFFRRKTTENHAKSVQNVRKLLFSLGKTQGKAKKKKKTPQKKPPDSLGAETLEDFVYWFPRPDWEKALENHLQTLPGLKDKRLVLARFKSAYESGYMAIQNARNVAGKLDADRDLHEPLPESQMQQLSQDWDKTYNLTINAQLEPADSLRGRVYREFKRKAMTVLEVRKIKTVVAASQPSTTEGLPAEA